MQIIGMKKIRLVVFSPIIIEHSIKIQAGSNKSNQKFTFNLI